MADTRASLQGDSLESKLATYKQKLKILKNAYKQEKEEKENIQKQLVSSFKTIDNLQKDLEEKEQKYLRTYKENQELHTELIEERSGGGRGHRGSVFVGHAGSAELVTGYKEKKYHEDYSPK